MREEDKIKNGLLFSPGDPELAAMKLKTHNLNVDYNMTHEDETEKRTEILHEIFAELGANVRIQGPIAIHYGNHTRIGDRFFANFNLTIQDDAEVTIGNDVNFGPNVTIVTPMHPMIADERNGKTVLNEKGEHARLCWAKPVKIGNSCWFGANTVVCPGVTIGNNCVIGAGSVVTHDIPDNCFAAGVPARVIREIGDADSIRHMPEILGGCTVISEAD